MGLDQELDSTALMEEALAEIERLRAELQQARGTMRVEPIAIIGAGCRFPGGVTDLDSYWRLLVDGVDAISEVPPERWSIDAFYSADPMVPGSITSRWGFLEGIDLFDAEFFGMSPREAWSTDPRQRLLLEVAWEALENAGVASSRSRELDCGVFVGASSEEYAHVFLRAQGRKGINPFFSSGVTTSMVAGRLAHVLGLRGPAMIVDTACSSSLAAAHIACQSLRARECSLAIAGGVNLLLLPEGNISTSRAHLLAPDGRCKAFDVRANGYVRSEGCAVIVLKRLGDAEADHDSILAVIRGSAVNHDGASASLTAPNGRAQEAVIRAALAQAGLAGRDVQAVEAHGTGTALGDPIELRALAAAYGEGRESRPPWSVGAVKGNIGHTEAAAGVAGLLKAALMLHSGRVPPKPHLHEPTPQVDWTLLPLNAQAGVCGAWPKADGPRRAGVSSFGYSGTNAHAILEQAPEMTASGWTPETVVYPLSARHPEALRELARSHLDAVRAADPESLADLARTASEGRAQHRLRLAVTASSAETLASGLDAYARGESAPSLSYGEAAEPPCVAFLFAGQGAQRAGAGRELYELSPVFRRVLDDCVDVARRGLSRPLRDVMFADDRDGDLHRTDYAQPALVALELALAAVWRSWGAAPDMVLGHSLGEIAAAAEAGVFSLEDAMRIAVERGRLMQDIDAPGAMATVMAGPEQTREHLARLSDEVAVAGINAPALTTISGPPAGVADACACLRGAGIATQILSVSHAFHSPMMRPVVGPLSRVFAKVRFSEPRIRLIPSSRAKDVSVASPDYWLEQVLAPVDFAGAIAAAGEFGAKVHLDVGPSPQLGNFGRRARPDSELQWLSSLRQGQGEWAQMQSALAALYVTGAPVDWRGVWAGSGARKTRLPTYPWRRQSYWVAEAPANDTQPGVGAGGPCGARIAQPGSRDMRWEMTYGQGAPRHLLHHRLRDKVVVAGATHIAAILAAGRASFGWAAATIENLTFPQAHVLGPGANARVSRLFRPDGDDGAVAVEVYGATEAATEAWTLHALGRMRGDRYCRGAGPRAADRRPAVDHGRGYLREPRAAGLPADGKFRADRGRVARRRACARRLPTRQFVGGRRGISPASRTHRRLLPALVGCGTGRFHEGGRDPRALPAGTARVSRRSRGRRLARRGGSHGSAAWGRDAGGRARAGPQIARFRSAAAVGGGAGRRRGLGTAPRSPFRAAMEACSESGSDPARRRAPHSRSGRRSARRAVRGAPSPVAGLGATHAAERRWAGSRQSPARHATGCYRLRAV